MANSQFRLRRRWLGAAFVLCALAAGGCGDDDGTPAGSTAPGGGQLAGTQWVLDVEALGVSGAASVSSSIAFERATVSGSDGCNRFSGPYETDGSELTFGALAGTQMACVGPADAVSRKVTAALPRVREYELAEETLRLKDGGGDVLLTYAASRPGVEGSWDVTSVLYNDAIRSVVGDVPLTAEFGADGSITGSTGCNTFSGQYSLQGEAIEIGPLASTRKACGSEEASTQEAGYVAALESAVKIDQVGDGLTLLNAKGQMAVVFTRR